MVMNSMKGCKEYSCVQTQIVIAEMPKSLEVNCEEPAKDLFYRKIMQRLARAHWPLGAAK